MATAAEAAQAATEAAGGEEGGGAGEGAQDGGTPQGGAAGAPGEGHGEDGGQPAAQPGAAPATGKPAVSETVRLARELRRAQARLQELEKRGAPAPVQQHGAATRESVLAELKQKYEADPEAFLRDVAGEDFYSMAKRVETRNAAPETRIEALERELAELKGTATNLVKDKETEAQKAADKVTQQHIEAVSKEIEAVDSDGNHKYPTLATLDPEALEEPVALTAYNAVARAWQLECTKLDEKTGKPVPFKKWTDEQVEKRFEAAFKALEAHYSKLRTPRGSTPGTQRTQDAESFAPTITTSTSSGPVERPQKAAPGTMPWDQALRLALKEQGLS